MRHGRRQFRPVVTGLEGRQLMSNTPLSTVATFKSGSNQSIVSAPAIDAQGDLYVSTSGGGEGKGKADGAVFEIPAGSKTPENLASFDGRTGYLIGGVTLDNQGNLFGTISGEGGSIGNGMAFEVAKGSKTPTTVASFNDYVFNQYGVEFPGGVIADGQGNLYGTAAIGGSNGVASVFEIPAGSNAPIPIAAFTSTAPAPKGLVMDAEGNLYGTNAGGGPYGAGSVYEIAKGSGTVTPLVTFNGINGAGISNVVVDNQGNLYGTTNDGGLYGYGTVFEIVKGSNTATTLATFDNLNGAAPDQAVGVVMDAQGNLFGTTESGGTNGYGTVFEIAKGSNTITTVANFTSTGQSMVSGLVPDNQGDLYGTTNGSGNSGGTVFKVTLNNPAAKT